MKFAGPDLGVDPFQDETLSSLEPLVRELIAGHEAKRRLWFPSELLSSCSDPEAVAALKARAMGVPDPVRVAVALGLLTEEGLPHFHRMFAAWLGDETVWQEWNNLWTAEEQRHGNVLQGYCMATGLINLPRLERLKFAYLCAGFRPAYRSNPYAVFVYAALQERVTQLGYTRMGRAVEASEPLLVEIVSRIAADEARHFAFYRRVFAEVLLRDPSGALAAAAEVMARFDMPGRLIPRYDALAEAVRVAGIYGPRDYIEILEQQIVNWGIERLEGLSPQAQRHQAEILALPKKLARLADFIERRPRESQYDFDFLVRPPQTLS